MARRRNSARTPAASAQTVRAAAERVTRRAEQMLELPIGTLAPAARLEVLDNRRATVEGCYGILEYEEGLVRLNTASGIIRFRGRGLTVQNLTEDAAVIGGFILAIEFGS